jgi:polyhydroxybutyrate depolymerase
MALPRITASGVAGAVTLCALLGLFLACNGGSDAGKVGTPTAASGMCSPGKAHASGDTTEAIQSGGVTRTFILHVPTGYDGTQAIPLVFNFHGANSNKEQAAFYTGLPQKADVAHFILITPDGTGSPRSWNFLSGSGSADDVAFVGDLLDREEASLCVDAKRVYATGASAGGAMTLALACAIPDRIAAVAPVSALFRPPTCANPQPIPVIEFHGTDDPIVPFHGGNVGGLPSPDIEKAAAGWARADGCAATPNVTQVTAHVKLEAYGTCQAGVVVQLYVVDGGGHTWPGGQADVAALGGTTHEISATDIIWDFFVSAAGVARGPAAAASPTSASHTLSTTAAPAPSESASQRDAPITAEQARSLLDGIVLKPADLPTGWKLASDATQDNVAAAAADPSGAASNTRCGRLLGRTTTNQPADVVAAFVAGQTVSFFSYVTAYATAAGAADCSAESSVRYQQPGQLARAFGGLFVDPNAVVVQPVGYPTIGDGSFAATLVGKVNASATVIDLTLLVVGFRKGNIIAVVGSAANGVPPTDELKMYVDLVLGRMDATTP